MFTCVMQLTRREFLLSAGVTLASFSSIVEADAATPRALSNGVDISWLPDVEAAGGRFFTSAGKRIDAISLLKSNGARVGRIRVFVNPDSNNGSLDRAIELAKRLKLHGMDTCIDLHYSDTWADPSNQATPAAWPTNISDLQQQVSTYTEETLRKFIDAGASPQWVQIGNEIAGGFLWPLGKIATGTPNEWQNFVLLHNAATKALRNALPKAKSMVHLESGGDPSRIRWWLTNASVYGLANYDVIGLSYYSQWQGNLVNLGQALTVVTSEFKKPVVVAETAYPWIAQAFGNDVLDTSRSKLSGISISPAGQQKFVKTLQVMLRQQPNNLGLGMWWWEGLATVVRSSSGANLWNGGMANSTLVDLSGKALPALKSLGG